jgi:hypothetical protein
MQTNRVYVGARLAAAAIESGLRGLPEVTEVSVVSDGAADVSRCEVRGTFDRDLVGAIDRLAREKNWELTQLHEATYSLEDTFIALTRRSRETREAGRRGVA